MSCDDREAVISCWGMERRGRGQIKEHRIFKKRGKEGKK